MTEQTPRRLHPLIAVSAASVILLSGVGIAKMMDWLPPTSAEAAAGSDAEAREKAAEEAQAMADRLAREQAEAAKLAEEKAAAEKAAAETAAQARLVADKAAAEKAAAGKLAAQKAAAAKAAQAKADAAARAAADRQVQQVTQPASQAVATCNSCGVVTAVTPVVTGPAPSGMGAVAGAILGGVLGHQVGGGTGKKVATAAGAIGGAYAGHVIEGKTRAQTTYNVSVRFDDGRTENFVYPQDPGVTVGTRINLEDGQLIRR